MPLPEAAQREWKHRVIVDSLARLGGFRDAGVEPVRASPLQLGYRNKVELTLARGAGGAVVIGFHRAGEEELVDVDRCLLQDDDANAVLATARTFFEEEPGRSDPIVKAGRDPARLMIRRSREGKTLVGIRSLPGPFPSGPALARRLMEIHPDVTGIVRVLAQPGRRGGARIETLSGEPWIEETLAGTRFRLPADTFFQVNREAAEILAAVVVECAGDVAGKEVLELYGGVGAFSFALAREGARATVVEADPEAVACGRDAANRTKPPVPSFVRSDVLRYLEISGAASRRPDLVVADPPRSGFGRGVAQAIAALAPPRIVLVSCDPATLARDARDLARGGFRLRRVVPVDLFPQTAEIEAVALLERHRSPEAPPNGSFDAP
jgi:23S rRNA (uracil1939-C5)-methyltransferase